MTTTDSAQNNGGAAPPDRQCHYTLANGQQCRRWAVRGRRHCHSHAHWLQLRASGPIETPLIEDPASIALLLSQTARALACGQIPPANGRAIIAACRAAQAALTHSLAEARFRLNLRRLGIPASEFLPEPATPPQPSAPPFIQPATEPPLQPETEPAPSAGPPEPCAPSSEPCFRGLKQQWDQALLRTENALYDMCVRRPGETEAEFLAARARPFDPSPHPEPLTR